MNMNREQERLNAIAGQVSYDSGVNGLMIEYCAEVFKRWFVGSKVLELGPAEGGLTQHLVEFFPHVEVVEASGRFARLLRDRFPGVVIHEALFEDYEPGEPFDTIVLGHVLEHIEDPRALLSRVRDWTAPSGRVLAATPNANSLHRQVGVTMGLLKDRTDLSESDVRIGHRRVFTADSLKELFLSTGFRVEFSGGFFLKVLSNGQLESVCAEDAVRSMMSLGESYPEIAAESYVVAG